MQGQAVDTGAHVDRIERQPNRFGQQLHRNSCSSLASQTKSTPAFMRMLQPERLRNSRGLVAAGTATRTGKSCPPPKRA
jgi:hypothetical protein